jgi:predicted RNA-binding protein YlxR (DUF448 family)
VTGEPRDPTRTCVGCRKTAGQRTLVRLKTEAGRVVFDGSRAGGRGAWLHPEAACLDRAIERRVFARAFREQGVQADAASLRVELTEIARKH